MGSTAVMSASDDQSQYNPRHSIMTMTARVNNRIGNDDIPCLNQRQSIITIWQR